MPIWDTPADEILRRISRDEFRFLTGDKPATYLTILVELYRARQQHLQLEVPFDSLLQALASQYRQYESEQVSDASRLRQDLNALQSHGNIQQRIEPRRIRRIQDRGLDRVLVRLTDSTSQILDHLQTRYEQLMQAREASARFSLIEVDDALSEVLTFQEQAPPTIEYDAACRAGRSLARARHAVAEAGDELLRLDLWLSELAVDVPDHERLLDLIQRLEAYFDRYLQEVEQRRQDCFEKLRQLMAPDAVSLLQTIDTAMAREFNDDPTRRGMRPRSAADTLATVNEFLEPNGILDERRHVVHERLADVAGHLKRHLAELVRRSQLLERLRQFTSSLIHAEDVVFEDQRADAVMTDLWQSAHVVLDETPGTPAAQATPPRPFRSSGAGRARLAGAVFTPRERDGQRDARALFLARITELNEFVDRAILRGASEASVAKATLEDPTDVRLLITAVRIGRQNRSPARRRHLTYQVAPGVSPKITELTTRDGAGRLQLPELIFRKGANA